jgi:hypothetical protein
MVKNWHGQFLNGAMLWGESVIVRGPKGFDGIDLAGNPQ